MNTHILIPITEHLEEAIRTGNVEYLSELVFRGKQISLDETKIDLSYIEYCKKNPTLHIIYKDFTEGYKQALKDLL